MLSTEVLFSEKKFLSKDTADLSAISGIVEQNTGEDKDTMYLDFTIGDSGNTYNYCKGITDTDNYEQAIGVLDEIAVMIITLKKTITDAWNEE
jgi:hypothetical protein